MKDKIKVDKEKMMLFLALLNAKVSKKKIIKYAE